MLSAAKSDAKAFSYCHSAHQLRASHMQGARWMLAAALGIKKARRSELFINSLKKVVKRD